jgi:predicted MFS family arabinose efflux permease
VAVTGRAHRGHLRAVLGERDFLVLMAARTTSLLGTYIKPVALTFAVLDHTGSASDLGLVLAAETFSVIFFLLVCGALADRRPRRTIMIAADVARFATTGAIALLLLTGGGQIWHLVVLQVASGAATAAFIPAMNGVQAESVRPALFKDANAVRVTIISLTSIAGPSLGGGLVVLLSPAHAIAVDALSFLVSALLVARLRVGTRPADQSGASLWRDLVTGWHEFRSRRWLWSVTAQNCVVHVAAIAPFMVLTPTLLGSGTTGRVTWSAVLVATGVGALVASLAATRTHPRRPLRLVILTGFSHVPMLLAVAAGAPAATVVAAAVVAGCAQAAYWTFWQTQLQEALPNAVRSRVGSFDFVGVAALEPLGLALAGPVALVVGAEAVLVGGAAMAVVASLWAGLLTRTTVAPVRAEPAPSRPSVG